MESSVFRPGFFCLGSIRFLKVGRNLLRLFASLECGAFIGTLYGTGINFLNPYKVELYWIMSNLINSQCLPRRQFGSKSSSASLKSVKLFSSNAHRACRDNAFDEG